MRLFGMLIFKDDAVKKQEWAGKALGPWSGLTPGNMQDGFIGKNSDHTAPLGTSAAKPAGSAVRKAVLCTAKRLELRPCSLSSWLQVIQGNSSLGLYTIADPKVLQVRCHPLYALRLVRKILVKPRVDHERVTWCIRGLYNVCRWWQSRYNRIKTIKGNLQKLAEDFILWCL